MRPTGTIYKRGLLTKKHGQVRIALPFKLKVFYHYLYFWGTCFLVASISGIILSFLPILKEETAYQLRSQGILEKPSYTASQIQTVEASDQDPVSKEAKELGIDPSFSIVIPKIDAKSNVFANVDTSDEEEYMDVLSKGVAHAKGTYFPGQGKNIFLFAHSTDSPINIQKYNAVFYLLSKLEKGDTVIIYFANKKYIYEVTEKTVKSASDISFLVNETQTEVLYLMTCTPPGTTWKRLFVTANLKE